MTITYWDYILLGALVLATVLIKFKKTKSLGAILALIIPVFMFFYFLIEGRFEIVFYLIIFLGIYLLVPYAVVKNEKKEETK